MERHTFLTEKCDGTIKGRTCANASIQLNFMTKEEATSPSIMTKSILITPTLGAVENQECDDSSHPKCIFTNRETVQ